MERRENNPCFRKRNYSCSGQENDFSKLLNPMITKPKPKRITAHTGWTGSQNPQWKKSAAYNSFRRPQRIGALEKWKRKNPAEAAKVEARFKLTIQTAKDLLPV